MKKFISKSSESKKLLDIIQVSATLPVNFIIRGEDGVGKELLAREILPNAVSIDSKLLENSIINKTINIVQYKELIVTNIQNVLNKKEFLENLKDIKIVATSKTPVHDIEKQFTVKLDIAPLSKRAEDLKEISKIYLKNANDVYDTSISLEHIN